MNEERPFSKAEWAGGCAVAALLGGLAMVVILINAGAYTESGGNGPRMLLGTIPGLIFGAIGFWRRRTSFGVGMLTGGVTLLILGGLCGAISSGG